MRPAITLCVLTILLSGCANGVSGIGKSEFTCNGIPGSSYCMSARDVYDATDGNDYMPDQAVPVEHAKGTDSAAERVIPAGNGQEAQQPGDVPPVTNINGNLVPNADGVVAYSETISYVEYEKPLPVRTQAKVMRVYITPWEDEYKNLNMSGYVFVEIEGRMWNIGHRPSIQNVPVVPVSTSRPNGIGTNGISSPVAAAPLPPGKQ